MRHSENMDKISPAIVSASAEVGNLFPSAKGHNYNYVPIEQLIDLIKPICHKNGLAVIQGPCESENGVGVETMVLHTSGQFIHISSSISGLEAKGMNKAQADGAAITYLRRYQLAAIFCTAADEDIDASTTQEPKSPEPQKPTGKPEAISDSEKCRLNDIKFKKAVENMDEDSKQDWTILYNKETTAEGKADVNYQIKIEKLLAGLTKEQRVKFDAENVNCRNVEQRHELFERVKSFVYELEQREGAR